MEVYINNFRGIQEETYHFSRGTNLLKGESGAGKTTVFEAIKWCLYSGMRDILPWDNEKAKIKVQVKIDEYTIIRTNRPSIVTVSASSGGRKYEGDEAKEKIRQLFGTKALWETCSYLGQDQRNFLLQASQREKTEVIKELLFDMTSEESEWYKDKFEKFKDDLRMDNAKRSGKIDSLRETVTTSLEGEGRPDPKELKRATKRKEDLLLYDKVEKKYNKICVKIDEYEKFKGMKVERDEMEKKMKRYPFPMSWKKMEKWEEYWKLRIEERELNEKEMKETKLSRDELLSQSKMIDKNYEILERFRITTPEQVQQLYDQKMNMLRNKVLVENNKRERKKKNSLNKKLSSLLSDLEDVQEEMDDVRSRKLFKEVRNGKGFLNQRKCSTLISRFEEIRDAKIRTCPGCEAKLILNEDGGLQELDESMSSKKSVQKKITLIDWMVEVEARYTSTLREIEMIRREISDLPEISEVDEENVDYNQLEIDCKLLSKFNYDLIEKKDIQPMFDFVRKKEIEDRIDQIRFPDSDYIFPTFPCELGDTPEEYVSGYLSCKDSIEKYDKFVERYEIIDESLYTEKIEKRDMIKEELNKLSRVKDVLNFGKIKEHLLAVSKNNNKISKASALADKIENLVNQNLQLFLTDFNNLINEMVSHLIDQMSVTLSLFKTTKVTKKTKCNVNVEINFKGHKIDNYSVLSGGQKDRLSLAFTLVFAKICDARFIFLDEFMSSLDEDLRGKCLDLIKGLRGDDGNLIVVNVCHETVEGCYNRIIEV